MKRVLSSVAMAASILSMAGLASAQIEIRPAPIHIVPDEASDAPQAQAALTPPPTMQMTIQVPVAPPPPVMLTAEESAFFIVLGKRLTDSASAYEGYMRRASALDGRFGGAPAVQRALLIGEDYDAQQLQEGAVAYAALLALRHGAFVAGVKAADGSVLERLSTDPQLVLQIQGADEAAADIASLLRRQAQALKAASAMTAKAAFDVQQQSWSSQPMDEPDKVLASAKAPRHIVAVAEDERALLQSVVGAPRQTAAIKPAPELEDEHAFLRTIVAASPAGAQTGPAPVVTRGLALAALAVAGRAGDANEPSFEALLKDQPCAECLNMAKMNLNQCLAVAGPNYEGVFCLGKHALGETAQCLIAALEAQPLPPASPAPVVRAAFKTPGPEEAAAYGLRPPTEENLPEEADAAPAQASAPPAAVQPPLQQAQQPPQAYAQRGYRNAPYGYAPPQPQQPQQPYGSAPYGYGPPAAYQRGYNQPYGAGGDAYPDR